MYNMPGSDQVCDRQDGQRRNHPTDSRLGRYQDVPAVEPVGKDSGRKQKGDVRDPVDEDNQSQLGRRISYPQHEPTNHQELRGLGDCLDGGTKQVPAVIALTPNRCEPVPVGGQARRCLSSLMGSHYVRLPYLRRNRVAEWVAISL